MENYDWWDKLFQERRRILSYGYSSGYAPLHSEECTYSHHERSAFRGCDTPSSRRVDAISAYMNAGIPLYDYKDPEKIKNYGELRIQYCRDFGSRGYSS